MGLSMNELGRSTVSFKRDTGQLRLNVKLIPLNYALLLHSEVQNSVYRVSAFEGINNQLVAFIL